MIYGVSICHQNSTELHIDDIKGITRPYIKTVARIILIPAISLLALYVLYIID